MEEIYGIIKVFTESDIGLPVFLGIVTAIFFMCDPRGIGGLDG